MMSVFAQGALVPLESPAYRLLERAENLGLLATPLPQLRPLNRTTVATHLHELDSISIIKPLSTTDRRELKKLLTEFSFELNGMMPKTDESRTAVVRKAAFSWLPNAMYGNGDDLFSIQDDSFRVRINPRFRYDVGKSPDAAWNGLRRMGFGWSAQMDWEHKLSVSFRYLDHFDHANTAIPNHTLREWQTNGISDFLVAGETPSIVTRNPDDPAQTRTSDEYLVSTTSLGYQLGKVHILVGREPVGWGPGERQKLTLGEQVSPLDQIRLDFDLSKHLRFVYIHGWLRADPAVQDTLYNPNDAELRLLDRPKYVAAHRLEWNPSHVFTLGVSEAVIYGDRAPDLAYLVPVNLFFASEENRGNNDNKSMTFDFTVRPVQGGSVYGGIWIDDLTFGKVGTSYLPNKVGYLAGVLFDDPLHLSNTRFYTEYTRMDPYAGAHYYAINRYEHWGQPLGLDLQPDADQLALHGEWSPTENWQLAVESSTMRHIDSARVNGYHITPGSILQMYPPGVASLGLPWGEGQGQIIHTFGLSARYEAIEHFWLAFGWQQQRSNFFNTQPEMADSYLPGALQHRPGLFDFGSSTFKYTNTLWTMSVLFNLDR